MSKNDSEALIVLIDHCKSVIEHYRSLINSQIEEPLIFFEIWDDLCDLVEELEEKVDYSSEDLK